MKLENDKEFHVFRAEQNQRLKQTERFELVNTYSQEDKLCKLTLRSRIC
jgi:hypothetical protein